MARVLTVKKTNDYTIQDRFEEYIAEKKALNLAEKTISGYKESFKKFADVIDVSMNMNDLDKKDITMFTADMLDQGDLRPTSINHYLRDIRAFVKWCMANSYLEKQFKIDLIKYQEEPKKTYTDTELKLLMKKPQGNNFVEYRTYACVMWIIGTGNRVSTVCNLKIGDIDFKKKQVVLGHTKNKKVQVIPLSASLIRIIRDYIKATTPDDIERSEYLFCSITNEQLTPNALKHAIRDYNLSRGVSITSAHALRHTFAKNYIASGGDCFKLQKILGHSTLDMTRKYVDLLTEDIQNDFEEHNLLEKLASPNGKKHTMKVNKAS